MKAIILSAGQGRRLLPLTAGTPKCGVEIAGQSLLEWQLGEVAQCGIDEVVVVTGFHADIVDDLVVHLTGGTPSYRKAAEASALERATEEL